MKIFPPLENAKTNPIKPNFYTKYAKQTQSNPISIPIMQNKPNQTQFQTKWLRGYEWPANKGRNSFYARRRMATGKAGKEALIYMHQEIIEVADGMDNRKANLRAATPSQNLYHRKKRSGAAHSKYKGIYWRKKNRK